MGEKQNIVAAELGYAAWIPAATPGGQAVAVEKREQSGLHILHAETPDQSEFYFEITAYPDFREHLALARQQQDFLRQQSPEGTLGEIRQAALGDLPATTFDFRGRLQGRWKERRFLFVDGAARTYRVVHDPTSSLNVQALERLELDSPGA